MKKRNFEGDFLLGIKGPIIGRGGGFSLEYQAVYDSLTTKPSAVIASAQDVLVRALISAGVWAKLDSFYLFAQTVNSDGEALKNWINPGTFNALLVNAPVFDALAGFTTNGIDNYINLTISPSDGPLWAQNDAAFGLYSRSDTAETAFDIGSYQTGSTISQMQLRKIGDTIEASINGNSDHAKANPDSRGLTVIVRDNATTHETFKNGVSLGTSPRVSTGVGGVPWYVGCRRLGGSPANFTTKQYSCAFTGGALTATEVSDMTNALEAYMVSNNRGITQDISTTSFYDWTAKGGPLYGWTSQLNNTLALDGDGNVVITYVDRSTGAVYFFNLANGLSEELINGTQYRIRATMKCTGSGSSRVYDGAGYGTPQALSTTLRDYEFVLTQVTPFSFFSFANMGAGDDVTIAAIHVYKDD